MSIFKGYVVKIYEAVGTEGWLINITGEYAVAPPESASCHACVGAPVLVCHP